MTAIANVLRPESLIDVDGEIKIYKRCIFPKCECGVPETEHRGISGVPHHECVSDMEQIVESDDKKITICDIDAHDDAHPCIYYMSSISPSNNNIIINYTCGCKITIGFLSHMEVSRVYNIVIRVIPCDEIVSKVNKYTQKENLKFLYEEFFEDTIIGEFDYVTNHIMTINGSQCGCHEEQLSENYEMYINVGYVTYVYKFNEAYVILYDTIYLNGECNCSFMNNAIVKYYHDGTYTEGKCFSDLPCVDPSKDVTGESSLDDKRLMLKTRMDSHFINVGRLMDKDPHDHSVCHCDIDFKHDDIEYVLSVMSCGCVIVYAGSILERVDIYPCDEYKKRFYGMTNEKILKYITLNKDVDLTVNANYRVKIGTYDIISPFYKERIKKCTTNISVYIYFDLFKISRIHRDDELYIQHYLSPRY